MNTIFENEAERFEERMRNIVLTMDPDDEEKRHIAMDKLMCETLEHFGCHKGVEIFRNTKKWYA